MKITSVVATCLLIVGLCFINVATSTPTNGKYYILFVGNSLTSKNNLPAQFLSLVRAGKKDAQVFASNIPAATFGLHVRNKYTMGMLNLLNWTHVVLQEQSGSLSIGLPWEMQRTWPPAKIMSDAAKPGKVVLYETMAYIGGESLGDTYEAMQQRIIDGYEALRGYLGCQTAHVGKTWRRARRALAARKKSSDFLYSDVVHPSPEGTFLAASTIYRQIFGTKVNKLRPKLRKGVRKSFMKSAFAWVEQEYQENIKG